jgi:transcriptional antiterminator RfaH
MMYKHVPSVESLQDQALSFGGDGIWTASEASDLTSGAECRSIVDVEQLFEGLQAPIDAPDSRWWVLYTRSRQEKVVAERLASRQIPCYLPLVERITISGKRKFKYQIPVFSNYVFLFGRDEDRSRALETNRISRVLDVNDQERLFTDLRQLWRLIGAGVSLTIESKLAPGQRVRIRRGPLAGIEGTILKRRGDTRLLVSVDFMRQGASVSIEDHLVEAA